MLSIGLMSGTSMDGIDAALLETDGSSSQVKDRGHNSLSYAPEFKLLLKGAEYAIRQEAGNLSAAQENFAASFQTYLRQELALPENQLTQKISELTRFLPGNELSLDAITRHSTQLHGQVVKQLLQKTHQDKKQITVVGYHGQTMYHQPAARISIVLGDGQQLANDLGIPVVNDFRSDDVASGGQGAPFAPLYHRVLALQDGKIPVAVVNCGGIANVTLIQGEREEDLVAFDTGPGNGLIDRLVRQRTGGNECMDRDGRYGKQGKINADVLEALFAKSLIKHGKNYLQQLPPKALDIGDMQLIPELDALTLQDACATLEAFTAETIINSLDLIQAKLPPLWILAGGGWHNPVIRQHLESCLQKRAQTSVQVLHADEAGWNSQAMEAQIFAYLAVRSLQNKPLSLPGTTGVPRPMTGGRTYTPA